MYCTVSYSRIRFSCAALYSTPEFFYLLNVLFNTLYFSDLLLYLQLQNYSISPTICTTGLPCLLFLDCLIYYSRTLLPLGQPYLLLLNYPIPYSWTPLSLVCTDLSKEQKFASNPKVPGAQFLHYREQGGTRKSVPSFAGKQDSST